MRKCRKLLYSQIGKRCKCGARALHARAPQTTNTHSKYVILISFYCNAGSTNTSQCYVIRTLPVLLFNYLPAILEDLPLH
jgi:hypothetical protein